MPPAPMGETTSYGPRRVPAANVMLRFLHGSERASRAWCRRRESPDAVGEKQRAQTPGVVAGDRPAVPADHHGPVSDLESGRVGNLELPPGAARPGRDVELIDLDRKRPAAEQQQFW